MDYTELLKLPKGERQKLINEEYACSVRDFAEPYNIRDMNLFLAHAAEYIIKDENPLMYHRKSLAEGLHLLSALLHNISDIRWQEREVEKVHDQISLNKSA